MVFGGLSGLTASIDMKEGMDKPARADDGRSCSIPVVLAQCFGVWGDLSD